MPSGIYERASGKVSSPSFKRNCVQCGKEFLSYESLKHVDCCSPACGYEKKKARYRQQTNCEHCKKEFTALKRDLARGAGRFCSRECNRAFLNVGKSPQWYKSKYGYIQNSRGKFQHREVMEQVLGRKLHKFENVHHKNGDRADNRPENLELWVVRQPQGARVEEIIDWAVAFLESQHFIVTRPTDQHDPTLLFPSPDAPVKHTGDDVN